MLRNRWGIGVRINGEDVGDVVVEGGKIERGRQSPDEDPQPDTLVLSLFTRDGYPQDPNAWFDYGVGDNTTAASHFTPDHDTEDTYFGPRTWIGIGAEVWVSATTDTHFNVDHDEVDVYEGQEYRRFTGTVNALDYEYERLHLTAVSGLEEWSRVALMVQPSTSPPEDPTDVDLAGWLATHVPSPTVLHFEGADGPVVYPWPAADYPLCLLDKLHELARDCDAIVYAKTNGNVTYQTRRWDPGTPTEIPAHLIDLDALGMQLELGTLRNHITVEYGPVIPDTLPGWPDRAQHVQSDPTSISAYGKRQHYEDSRLVGITAAQDHAQTILNACALEWNMPDLNLPMKLAGYDDVQAIALLDLGNLVNLSTLPLGSPVPDWTGEILGYTEFLSSHEWDVELHLRSVYTRTYTEA